jgi:predicted nucleotidyltransferase
MGEPLTAAHLSGWRQRYHVQRIGLFGSTARNEATADSDVDVWVELHHLTLRQAILRDGVSASASLASTTQVGETESLMSAPPALVP